jgi:ubiquinone/menaquinone biosynthesis C-methylase UbiE
MAWGMAAKRKKLANPLIERRPLRSSFARGGPAAIVQPVWPSTFARIPSEAWTEAPLEELALKYDRVDNHGWYTNLDPTVEDVAVSVRKGDRIVDYSGGTGIFLERLFARTGRSDFGVLEADSSPKFLRLALEKFRSDPRVAFRLIPFSKEARRLLYLDEILGRDLPERPFNGLVSTNAIHLYHDLKRTLASWHRVLHPGSRVFVQSGNIRGGGPAEGRIIDDTVHAVDRRAREIVATDSRFRAYRAALEDAPRMEKHDALRGKIFPPPRSVETYLEAFREAGFDLEERKTREIPVQTKEWEEFLAVYHEGILGWVGGSERVEGHPPRSDAVEDRLRLLRLALEREVGNRSAFEATWTYLTWRATG